MSDLAIVSQGPGALDHEHDLHLVGVQEDENDIQEIWQCRDSKTYVANDGDQIVVFVCGYGELRSPQ